MKIYFARHGQTDWNIQRKVQGTTDIPLNENGIRQAQELCKNLEDRKISFEQSHTIEVENATPIEFSIEELKEIRKKL